MSHGITARRISRLDAGFHIADLDDTVRKVRVHGSIYASGNLDTSQAHDIILELHGVVRGVHIYSVRDFGLRRNDKASSRLQMVKCFSILQMDQY